MRKNLGRDQESVCGDISRMWDGAPVYRPVMKLNDNLETAMEMAQKIEEIVERLPGLDCGSCGSPNCRALAEDIVRGYAQETDCIFVTRERLKTLLEHVNQQQIKLPQQVVDGLEPEKE